MRALQLFVFLTCCCASPSCGSKASDAPAKPASVIRAMQLDNTTTSTIVFESVHAHGKVEITPDVLIGYENSTTTKQAATTTTDQRTLITIDGLRLLFDGPELTIGEKSYGKLAGEVLIKIAKDGVTVNGEKRGEL